MADLPVPDPPDDVREVRFGPMCCICFNPLTPETCAEDQGGTKWDLCPGKCAAKAGVITKGAVVVFAEGLPMGARLEPAADPDCELCEGTNAVEDANGDCFDCRPCMDTPTMFRRVLTDKEPQP